VLLGGALGLVGGGALFRGGAVGGGPPGCGGAVGCGPS
jgi:hypothetical protein